MWGMVKQTPDPTGQSKEIQRRQGRGPLLRIRVADVLLDSANEIFTYLFSFIMQGFDQRNNLLDPGNKMDQPNSQLGQATLDFRIPQCLGDRAMRNRSQVEYAVSFLYNIHVAILFHKFQVIDFRKCGFLGHLSSFSWENLCFCTSFL